MNTDYLYLNQVNDEALSVLYGVGHYPGTLREFKKFVGEQQKEKFTFVVYDSLTDGKAWGTVRAGKPFDFKLVYRRKKEKTK